MAGKSFVFCDYYFSMKTPASSRSCPLPCLIIKESQETQRTKYKTPYIYMGGIDHFVWLKINQHFTGDIMGFKCASPFFQQILAIICHPRYCRCWWTCWESPTRGRSVARPMQRKSPLIGSPPARCQRCFEGWPTSTSTSWGSGHEVVPARYVGHLMG